jgi:glycosyltransferase involved in cell wall biosynthesis
LLSVCIPAFNRSVFLPPLLESVLSQAGPDLEVVICEDDSAERDAIRSVVDAARARGGPMIRYFENERNLGYDGNLRRVISHAKGAYCLFLGNDDLLAPGAVATVTRALVRHGEVGVILRTYASFDDDPGRVDQVFRYFDAERVFPPGPQSVTAFFRRSVVLPGLVLNTAQALRYETDRFDGTLLYQLHLVANILLDLKGVFLPEVVALYRNGGRPDFGTSVAERGKFVPGKVTPEASVHFVRGLLDIARDTERARDVEIFAAVEKDLANYAYPLLAIQSSLSRSEFRGYCGALGALGLGSYPMFHVWVAVVRLLGTGRVESFIRFAKRLLGRTPLLGRVYKGEAA